MLTSDAILTIGKGRFSLFVSLKRFIESPNRIDIDQFGHALVLAAYAGENNLAVARMLNGHLDLVRFAYRSVHVFHL
jgi:hypothetical protein